MARYRLDGAREKKPLPFEGRFKQTIETGGRTFELSLTAANEVVVIDAQDHHWLDTLNRQFASEPSSSQR